MQYLNKIFGQLIQPKWNYCLKRIKMLNIYYVFTKYGWVKPLKDKTALNAFIQIVNESNHKPNK